MSARHAERGIALASVLWTVAALSLIAAAMLSSSMNAARISRNSWSQLQVQTAADEAIQRAILSLFDPSGHAPFDGATRQIAVDGATVGISVQDEMGRIDINYAGHSLLRDLFKSAGAEDPDALADRVVDWRSPKGTRSLNGASSADYGHAGYAYRPRGAPFQSVDELALVMGVTPDIFARVAPGLTVYSHSPNFDMRVAPKQVLMAISGMSADDAARQIAVRDAPASGASSPLAALPGQSYAITAEASQGRMRAMRQAVVLLSGNPAHPYWVLDWK